MSPALEKLYEEKGYCPSRCYRNGDLGDNVKFCGDAFDKDAAVEKQYTQFDAAIGYSRE